MGKTLSDLSVSLKRRVRDIETSASKRAVKVTEAVVTDLLNVTPVDTSRAMSNWQVSLNEPIPNSAEIDPYYPGIAGNTTNASWGAAHREAFSVLTGKKPGDKIFISNVTSYIGDLNRGSSRQFAGGFTKRARLVAKLAVKNG